ncbi:MAG: hypothetical protein U0176_07410 [Bacteroidia bacterium]
MVKRLTLIVFMALGFAGLSLHAQNASVASYAGEYSCITHGVSGLRIEATPQGHKLVFCRDLITNTCQEFALHKTLGKSHELLAASGDAGAPLRGMSATFTTEGAEPIIQLKTEDGLNMEFVRR